MRRLAKILTLSGALVATGCFPSLEADDADMAVEVDVADLPDGDGDGGIEPVGTEDSGGAFDLSDDDTDDVGDEPVDSSSGDVDASSSVCSASCPAPTTPCKIARCDMASGTCMEVDADDGADCDDGSVCTELDKCHAGRCEPGTATNCAPSGSCAESASCDPVEGCTDVPKDDGTPCQASAGTYGACQGGVCQSPICGGVTCPAMANFIPSCNSRAHCEYRLAEIMAPWQEDIAWIYVPPGTFPQGAPDGEEGRLVFELPVHTVIFSTGFFLEKYPVTTRVYEACQAVGLCSLPAGPSYDPTGWGTNRSSKNRATHPQNSVTRAQARTVCGWLVPTGRLPSEAEWEYAANGPTAHRTYPWGPTPEPTCENATAVFDDGQGAGCGSLGTWPVGAKSAGASAVGAYDMAGNVAEWTDDCWHDSYEGAPMDGSAWTSDCLISRGAPQYVQRGGGFTVAAPTLRTAARIRVGDHATIGGGVRCVWSSP